MAVEHQLYFGYYFDIPPLKTEVRVTYTGCPQCQTNATSKFCPTCGAPCQTDLMRTKESKHDGEAMCNDLGEEWEDFIATTDPSSGEHNNIAVLNNGGELDFDWSEHAALNLLTRPIPPMDDQTQRFLAAFRQKYGDDSITVCYGLVNWQC
jgi:hypothetical protein